MKESHQPRPHKQQTPTARTTTTTIAQHTPLDGNTTTRRRHITGHHKHIIYHNFDFWSSECLRQKRARPTMKRSHGQSRKMTSIHRRARIITSSTVRGNMACSDSCRRIHNACPATSAIRMFGPVDPSGAA